MTTKIEWPGISEGISEEAFKNLVETLGGSLRAKDQAIEVLARRVAELEAEKAEDARHFSGKVSSLKDVTYAMIEINTFVNDAEKWRRLGSDDDRVYEKTIRIINRGKRSMLGIRRHSCEWNSNDYCVYCGADGRA